MSGSVNNREVCNCTNTKLFTTDKKIKLEIATRIDNFASDTLPPDHLISKYENILSLVPKNNTDFHKITIYENNIIELYQPINALKCNSH